MHKTTYGYYCGAVQLLSKVSPEQIWSKRKTIFRTQQFPVWRKHKFDIGHFIRVKYVFAVFKFFKTNNESDGR